MARRCCTRSTSSTLRVQRRTAAMPQREQVFTVSLTKPFLVDVIGFNPVERSMLSSIFALAARRDPGFVQFDPAAGGSANIYLVDADAPESLAEFQALNKRADLHAVLVGSVPAKPGSIVLARPLQWARLL